MRDETLAMLADAAAAFAKVDGQRVRRALSHDAGFDRKTWTEMAGQGWLAILAPEDRGGLGLGMGASTVVARQLGRAAYPEPFAAGTAVVACLSEAEPAAAWEQRLAMFSAGELLVSLAWQNVRGDLCPGVTAADDGGHVILAGESRLVAAPTADAFLVLAHSGEGQALYWVGRDETGLAIDVETSADGSRSARIRFDAVRVASNACLIAPARGAEVMCRAMDVALIVSSAELLGVMDQALEMTLEYLRTRVQFNVPIGSFQALQHRAVDMWIQRQLTEAALGGAVSVFDNPRASTDERSAAASGLKARAAQAALFLCNQALQLHGGIGFAEEYGLGLYLNRAITLSAWLGNAGRHRRRFGELYSGAGETAGGAA